MRPEDDGSEADDEAPGAPDGAHRMESTSGDSEHERTSEFLLRRVEAEILPWLAERLPTGVVPDHMTLLGVVASVGIAASYLLTNQDPAWLWAASAGLVVQWFGDSLDGTLAYPGGGVGHGLTFSVSGICGVAHRPSRYRRPEPAATGRRRTGRAEQLLSVVVFPVPFGPTRR